MKYGQLMIRVNIIDINKYFLLDSSGMDLPGGTRLQQATPAWNNSSDSGKQFFIKIKVQ